LTISIDSHTLERAKERGTTAEEIRDVLEAGFPIEAKRRRLGKAKVYEFNRARRGKFYKQKRVEVIYTTREDEVVTVTVYVFFGQWGGPS